MDFTENESALVVAKSFETTSDLRLRELLQGLVHHLHAYVREARPTMAEWEAAIAFLTETGQTCSDARQEFILLSDVLGVSMLIETINGADARAAEGATASTVLGPFHMTGSPRRNLGDTLYPGRDSDVCVIEGRVVDTAGRPVAGAVLDVWQADDKGFYDVQQPDVQPPGAGRGIFAADPGGCFWFRTVTPCHYPIPTDGPVGKLLGVTGRHPYRPAHVHFIVDAPGHERLTTHVFVAGSEYLDSDAVFAVKHGLVRGFQRIEDPAEAARYDVVAPFTLARFDIVLGGQP
ncbi:Protocatechuate 3,4-dioxygenase beta subunit [Micromonospora rhizosphaerae]|uniref:Protocatechuate 3,4-dioxygenase beta subunit n=1 Tax=Micromonospora rhizosphaerae TaxID=568872 RepID=A0A1C6SDA5_9ACTN|nr:dioxygenase [Micromonospora rhizosphaerae]SCL27350.1 Protocatechuate 3,4-dioxygenase beta subunit [Micromonospora rhizosphaerae]